MPLNRTWHTYPRRRPFAQSVVGLFGSLHLQGSIALLAELIRRIDPPLWQNMVACDRGRSERRESGAGEGRDVGGREVGERGIVLTYRLPV